MRGLLAQKNYNALANFRQFSDLKNRGRSQQRSVLGQFVIGELQGTGISCPKESKSFNE